MIALSSTETERFWSRVEKSPSCWIWQGALSPKGMARYTVGTRTILVHHIAWTLISGPIPFGMRLLHTCENYRCVNPAHLQLQEHVISDRTDRLAKRLWEKVRKTEDCWLWTGPTQGMGYGHLSVGRQDYRAHRAAWELTYGPIPRGMLVCHKCDVPSCVRPDHLFLGTFEDNNRDIAQKNRTAYGERNSKAKLTEDYVRQIHQLYIDGRNLDQLAEQFQVDRTAIWLIVKGKNWQRVYKEIHNGH